MQIASIELYDLLKPKIGEKEAKALVSFVENETENNFAQKKEILATKQDIADVRQEISSLEVRLSRAIYIVGLVQYLAIVASIIAIVKYVLK